MIQAMVRPHTTGPARRRAILTAIRAMLDAGELVSVDALAAATGIPRGTVARHLAILRRAGMVETTMGPGGGVRLTVSGRIATDPA